MTSQSAYLLMFQFPYYAKKKRKKEGSLMDLVESCGKKPLKLS